MSSYVKRHKKNSRQTFMQIYKSVNIRSGNRRKSKSINKSKLKRNSESLRKLLRKKIVYSPITTSYVNTKLHNIFYNMSLYEEKYMNSIEHSIKVLEDDIIGKIKNKGLNKDLINNYIILLKDINKLHEILDETEISKKLSNNINNDLTKEVLKMYIEYFSSKEFKNTYKKYMKQFFNTSNDNKKIIDTFYHALYRPIERINKYREFLDELYIIYKDTEYSDITELICKSQNLLGIIETCIKEDEKCDYVLKDEDVVCRKKKRSIF